MHLHRVQSHTFGEIPATVIIYINMIAERSAKWKILYRGIIILVIAAIIVVAIKQFHGSFSPDTPKKTDKLNTK